MYDLPSEDPEEPGLPDEFHYYQPQLLRETFRPAAFEPERFFVGTDINLYYDARHTGWHKRPDWFAVLGAPRLDRQQDLRLSYVVWQEDLAPYIVVELLSPGTEGEDLGKTLRDVNGPPNKWVVYEQVLKVPYYFVYSRYSNKLRAFGLMSGRYRELIPAERGLWLLEAGIGIGVWSGRFEGIDGEWLRCYDAEGRWLPTKSERRKQADQRAAQERQRAEQADQRAEDERQQAEQERQRAERERQRAEQADQRAEDERQQAEQERQRAEQAGQRAEDERQQAEQERQRAEREHRRAERLVARLKAFGIDLGGDS